MKPNATSPQTTLAPSGGTIAVAKPADETVCAAVWPWRYELDADLEPAQHIAVAVLASGGTVVGAATAAGISRATLWGGRRRMQHSPLR